MEAMKGTGVPTCLESHPLIARLYLGAPRAITVPAPSRLVAGIQAKSVSDNAIGDEEDGTRRRQSSCSVASLCPTPP
eukprot:3061624-Rhodomonas_salina.1